MFLSSDWSLFVRQTDTFLTRLSAFLTCLCLCLSVLCSWKYTLHMDQPLQASIISPRLQTPWLIPWGGAGAFFLLSLAPIHPCLPTFPAALSLLFDTWWIPGRWADPDFWHLTHGFLGLDGGVDLGTWVLMWGRGSTWRKDARGGRRREKLIAREAGTSQQTSTPLLFTIIGSHLPFVPESTPLASPQLSLFPLCHISRGWLLCRGCHFMTEQHYRLANLL